MTKSKRATASLPEAPGARFRLPRSESSVLTADDGELLMGHTERLLCAPTAPYAEDAPLAVVESFAAARPTLVRRRDPHGNLLLTWPGNGRTSKAPQLAFSAHLDHPGFHYRGMRDGRRRASFHGGVPLEYMVGGDVRFFDPKTHAACATARVRRAEKRPDGTAMCELSRFRGRARRGMFGAWDLTPGRISGRRFRGRVCDDLLPAAASLALLDLLAERRHPRPVTAIFTRAEETGFVGCMGLLRSGLLGRALGDVHVIGLECSPRRTTAKVGLGPVIRVGDGRTVFDPAICAHLQTAAATLAKKRGGFPVQRALMDGGSCESTAYNLWGVPAGGLCLALGNYHNTGPQQTIAEEFVDWFDFEGLLALMLEAASAWPGPRQPPLRAALNERWQKEYKLLAASARRTAQT
ncbi:MAG: M20/M25/M40 family metallo-hydrolase [Planctomycetota bacterium]|jgi:endoglucanase|nr:M20/M25/M40 family metallo-hydrolase [Planctomycetota bacterium]